VLRRLGIPALFFVNTAPIVEGRILAVHKTHLLRSVVSPMELLALLRRAAQGSGIECDRSVPLDNARRLYPYDDDEAASLKYLLNAVLTPQERDALVEACFAEVFPGKERSMRQELYMCSDQIRSLDGSIGSHTHAHLALGLIDEGAAKREIELSLSHLTEWLGNRPFAVSYPYGSREICTTRVGEMTRAAGVDYAFTMERAANRTFANPHHLARIDCNDAPGGKSCPFGPDDLFDALPKPSWFPT
jgi:peptidoglycan/xylan/chitin deacetylase (PgdA/CDA1 family)